MATGYILVSDRDDGQHSRMGGMQIFLYGPAWDNGVKLGWYAGTNMDQYFSVAPGFPTVTVLDLDANFNIIHQSSVLYFA